MACLDGVGVMAFPPGTDLGPEPGGYEVAGGGSAGRVGGRRVEEVRHQPGGTGRIKAFGFVGDNSRVLPGHGTRGQGLDHRRQGADPAGLVR